MRCGCAPMQAMALFCIMNIALIGYGLPVSMASSSISGLIAAIALSAGYLSFMVSSGCSSGLWHPSHTHSRGSHVTLMSHTGFAATIEPGFSKLPVRAIRSKHAMPVINPSDVWSIATPHCKRADFAWPISRAASTTKSSSTPHVFAANDAGYFFTFSANSL